eukprot:Skav220730  [mRNA]  locus=scaffold2753:219970:224391:- [translate_table: standard]
MRFSALVWEVKLWVQEEQEKSQFKAKKLQSKASNTAELEETKAEKESDVKYSTDLNQDCSRKATCDKKASAFKQRQQTRQEELEAIGKAQEIISGGAVAGSAQKHLPRAGGPIPAAEGLAAQQPNAQRPGGARGGRPLGQGRGAASGGWLDGRMGGFPWDENGEFEDWMVQWMRELMLRWT